MTHQPRIVVYRYRSMLLPQRWWWALLADNNELCGSLKSYDDQAECERNARAVAEGQYRLAAVNVEVWG